MYDDVHRRCKLDTYVHSTCMYSTNALCTPHQLGIPHNPPSARDFVIVNYSPLSLTMENLAGGG